MIITYKNKSYDVQIRENDNFLSDIEDYDREDISSSLPNFVNAYNFEQYMLYLQGEEFEMDDSVAKVFDFMGYENSYNDVQFWRARLMDTKLYDFTNKLSEKSKELLKKLSDSLPKGFYIAGGFLTAIASQRDRSFDSIESVLNYVGANDLDIFCTEKVDTAVLRKFYQEHYGKEGEVKDTVFTKTIDKIQMITKIYNSPKDIVDNFDLHPCAFILVDRKLMATSQAIYSIENMVNPVELTKWNQCTKKRIKKYTWRGFKVKLVDLDDSRLNIGKLSYITTLLSIINSLSHRSVNDFIMPDDLVMFLMNLESPVHEHYSKMDITPDLNFIYDEKEYLSPYKSVWRYEKGETEKKGAEALIRLTQEKENVDTDYVIYDLIYATIAYHKEKDGNYEHKLIILDDDTRFKGSALIITPSHRLEKMLAHII